MRLFTLALLPLTVLFLPGCSSDTVAKKDDDVRTVAAGEKAGAGHLTYNIVDSQFLTQLGEDPNPRVPHDRFLMVQIAVTNSSNVDNPIPAVELVADDGKVYNELSDGTGVSNWLGVVRHVGTAQTERGDILFDAPPAHYKLRFSDESANTQVMADLPLNYAHEKDSVVPTSDLPDLTPQPPSAPPAKK
jgi:hypothetical protein